MLQLVTQITGGSSAFFAVNYDMQKLSFCNLYTVKEFSRKEAYDIDL